MLIHIPAVAIGKWYGKNKGKALSLSIMGFSIGEAIFPVIFVFLFSIIGWRYSWISRHVNFIKCFTYYS